MAGSGILPLRLAAMSLLVAILAAAQDLRPADGRSASGIEGDTPHRLRASAEVAAPGEGTARERRACGAFAQAVWHRDAAAR